MGFLDILKKNKEGTILPDKDELNDITLEEIYYKVMNAENIDNELKYFLENDKLRVQTLNFKKIYEILNVLKENNSKHLKTILNFLRKDEHNILTLFILFVFDNKYRNNEVYNDLLKIFRTSQISVLNIVIDELKKYSKDGNFSRLYCKYEYAVLDIYDAEDYKSDSYFAIDFNKISEEYLSNLLVFLATDDKFIEDFNKYLNKNPSKMIEIPFLKDYCELFKKISKNIKSNGITYEEIGIVDDILKNKCNFEEGFDFSLESIKKLCDYYQKNDSEIIPKNLLVYLKKEGYYIDFKTLNENEIIDISTKHSGLDVLLEMYKTSKRKDISIIISPSTADECYDILKEFSIDSKIYINYTSLDGEGKITLEEYIKAHNFYDGIAEYINRFEFSPLEKYLFAYYLSSKFKKYEYYKSDRQLDLQYSKMSRDPYFIINHDYIVCAGFTNFMLQILKRIDIVASFLGVSPPEVNEPHARVMSHLVDSKYNIDGVYIGDPTVGALSYALITKTKASYEKYQEKDFNSKSEFLNAMCNLDLDDKYKTPANECFFDIINRKIPDSTIIEALRNILNKFYPSLKEEQIEEKIGDFLKNSRIKYVSPYLDLNRSVYDLYDEKVSYECFVEDLPINNLEIRWVGGGYSNDANSYVEYRYLIIDKFNPEETGNILFTNKSKIENSFVKITHDSYYDGYLLKIKVPIHFTGNQYKEVFLQAVIDIYNTLGYSLEKKQNSKKSDTTELTVTTSVKKH